MSLQDALAIADLEILLNKAFAIAGHATGEVAFCSLTTFCCSRFLGWWYELPPQLRVDWYRFAVVLQLRFFVNLEQTREWSSMVILLLRRDAPLDGIAGTEIAHLISSTLLLVLYLLLSWGLYHIWTPIVFFYTHGFWIFGFFWGSVIGAIGAFIVYRRFSAHFRGLEHPRLQRVLNLLKALPFILGYAIYNFPLLAIELARTTRKRFTKSIRPMLEQWYFRRPSTLYKYRALDPKVKEIRLIQLQRRFPGAEISCKFVHVPIDQAPEYEAISYTWGGGGKDHLVFLEDMWLPATKNVYRILHDRSSHMRARCIWIDAICIDQDNLSEKSVQVEMMGLIYRKAERVIVWLDNELITHTELTEAMFLLELISFNALDLAKDLYDPPTRTIGLRNHWEALGRLLSHPYWNRVWIIQEVAMAKKVHVLYGNKYLSWDQLAKMVYVLHVYPVSLVIATAYMTYGLDKSNIIQGASQVSNINVGRYMVNSKDSNTLVDYVLMTQNCVATDSRDKIFALKNLAHNSKDYTSIQGIEVDYTLSVQEVYRNTARYLIKHDLDFLLSVAGIGWQKKTQNLSSWVPDFVQLPNSATDRGLNLDARSQAGLGGKVSIEEDILTSTITLKAIPVSQISQLSKTSIEFEAGHVHSEPSTSHAVKALKLLHKEAWNIVDKLPSKYKATGQSTLEAFWRTLIEDRHIIQNESENIPIEYRRPASAEFGLYYMTCREELFREGDMPKKELEKDSQRDAFQFNSSFHLSRAIGRVWQGRKFATTGDGLMAVVPPETLVGDLLCVVPGFARPVLLRRIHDRDGEGKGEKEGKRMYEYVGTCYAHGIMDGELFESRPAIQIFTIT